jgi:flagellar biosynthesis protein FliR
MLAKQLIEEGLKVAPLVALVSLRVAVVFALMPSPFGEVAPGRIRAVLSFLVALALTLPSLGHVALPSMDPPALFVSALSELFVGAVIGLTARVTLAAAEIAGTLAGNAMGLGFASQIDPLFGSEGVPTSSIINSLGVLIFFVLRGHHVLIEALSASLILAPCGAGFPEFRPENLLRLGGQMVAQGLRIASPVVATMFLVQLGTALIARAAPRVQIFALSFGVTVSIGGLILVMSAPQLAQALANVIATIPDTLAQMLPGRVR